MFPVALMCRLLGVSRSGYYAARSRKPSSRSQSERVAIEKIREIHQASRSTYGSPRIYAALRKRSFEIGRHRIARLMRKYGITARHKRKFRRTTEADPSLPVTENLLNRRFHRSAPDRAWVTDITYLRTEQGWLYLAVVLDLFSRRVVGWSMASHLRKELALGALEMALGHRTAGKQLVHHSDRGCQYASDEYRRRLSARKIQCSMSRKGDCWDNAVAESFFGTLKTELAHRTRWSTREEARAAVFEYIEVFYNRQRLHSSLGYLSPVEFEKRYQVSQQVAA